MENIPITQDNIIPQDFNLNQVIEIYDRWLNDAIQLINNNMLNILTDEEFEHFENLLEIQVPLLIGNLENVRLVSEYNTLVSNLNEIMMNFDENVNRIFFNNQYQQHVQGASFNNQYQQHVQGASLTPTLQPTTQPLNDDELNSMTETGLLLACIFGFTMTTAILTLLIRRIRERIRINLNERQVLPLVNIVNDEDNSDISRSDVDEVVDDLERVVRSGVSGSGMKRSNYIVQSITFDKNKFTKKQAEKWLRENKYKVTPVDEKPDSYRYRQEDPDKIRRQGYDKFITKTLMKKPTGVNLVIAYKKMKGGELNALSEFEKMYGKIDDIDNKTKYKSYDEIIPKKEQKPDFLTSPKDVIFPKDIVYSDKYARDIASAGNDQEKARKIHMDYIDNYKKEPSLLEKAGTKLKQDQSKKEKEIMTASLVLTGVVMSAVALGYLTKYLTKKYGKKKAKQMTDKIKINDDKKKGIINENNVEEFTKDLTQIIK